MKLAIHCLILACWISSPVLARAPQERTVFDRRTHLEGYEEAFFSEWSDLYDFEAFAELEGKSLTLGQLTAAQDRWKAQVAEVLALVESLNADPYRLFVHRLESRLAKHAFFSRIGYQKDDSHPPFVFFVQDPPKAQEGYHRKVVERLQPHLEALRQEFERSYVQPMTLVRRPDHGAYAVIVLASGGDRANYVQLSGGTGHYASSCLLDERLKAAVLFEDPFQPAAVGDRVRSAAHGVAHLFFQAHSRRGSKFPQETAIAEGLASYLADHKLGPDGRLSLNPVRDHVLREFADAMGDPKRRRTHVHLVDALLDSQSYMQAARRIEASAAGQPVNWNELWRFYWRQSYLFVRFLHRDEHRPGFQRYLERLFKEHVGLAAFETSFDFGGWRELDRAFFDDLYAQHRRAYPQRELSAAAVERLLAGDAVVRNPRKKPVAAGPPAGPRGSTGRGATGSAGGGKPAEAAPPAAPPLTLEGLSPEARFAGALFGARDGRTGAAAAAVAALLAGADDAAFRARLERESERLARWNDLRRAYLEHLAAEGKSLRMTFGDKTERLRIAAVDGEEVRLSRPVDGQDALPLDELDGHQLASAMGRTGDDLAGGERWVRLYPYALAGDERLKRLLTADDPASSSLREDAAGDYGPRFALGAAVQRLERLVQLGEPETEAQADAVLAELEPLVGDHGGLELVTARLPALRARAAQAWGRRFDGAGPAELVQGDFESLGENRVRLTYDFDDPAQRADFRATEDLKAHVRNLPALKTDVESSLGVERGRLRATGSSVHRHLLDFAAPMVVRYDVAFAKDEVEKPTWVTRVGLCEAGPTRVAWSIDHGRALEIFEGRSSRQAYPEVPLVMYRGDTYGVELHHDGETITVYHQSDPLEKLPAGSLQRGGLVLVFHSDLAVTVDTLVIEGVLDEASLAQARDAWVAERVTF